MRRLPHPFAVVVIAAACAAGTVEAQSKVTPFLGAGAVLPMGDFGTYGNTGWMAYGGASIPTSNPKVSVNLWAFYGHVGHEGGYNQATNIPGVDGEVQLNLATKGKVLPYVAAGVTVLQHRFDAGGVTTGGSDSETKAGIGLGGGATFVGSSSTAFYADAHYFAASDTNFLVASVGVVFNMSPASAIRRLPGLMR